MGSLCPGWRGWHHVAVITAALALVNPVPATKMLTLKTVAGKLMAVHNALTDTGGAVERLFSLQHRFHPGMK